MEASTAEGLVLVPEREGQKVDLADAGVFERLYAEWSDPVYRYLVHLNGAGPATEDLFQDTWMKAIEHRAQLKEPSLFGSWVFRIARNLTLNDRRTRRRKTQVWIISNLARDEDDPADGLLDREPDRDGDPRQKAMGNQRLRVVREALLELEPITQEMIQLRYFEHLKLAEVARVLDVPLGTVCTKIHRALKTVRSRLEGQGYKSLEVL